MRGDQKWDLKTPKLEKYKWISVSHTNGRNVIPEGFNDENSSWHMFTRSKHIFHDKSSWVKDPLTIKAELIRKHVDDETINPLVRDDAKNCAWLMLEVETRTAHF